VIIAWSLSYLAFSVTAAWGKDTTGFFLTDYLHAADAGVSGDVVAGVFWPLAATWLATLVILALGIRRGLERATRVMLPLLAVMFVILVVRAVLLPGATDGLNAFFTPVWSALAEPGVWVAAYGQIFFSLSVAFGIMITYASYLRPRSNLAPTGFVVAFSNSSFEILAGIGVFSALGFMASQSGTTIDQMESITGVGLAFMAFPQIISMMPASPVFGVLFFGSLTLAGFTSLLSILQVVSAAFQDKFGWTPRQGAVRVGGVAALSSLALFSTTTGLPVLDTVDKYVNEVGVVGSAVVTTVLVAWVLRRAGELRGHLSAVSTLAVGRWWTVMVGLVVPLVLGYMLTSASITLALDGYGGYPAWFTNAFGWGMVGLLVLAAVGLGLTRWRWNPDAFEPVPVSAVSAPVSGRGQAHPAEAPGGDDR
jgi:NSS family neurotransmitter:Na+ symporter